MSNTDTATLDKVAGIVVIASSACGVCVGAAMLGLGGVVGFAGTKGAVSGQEFGIPAAAAGGAIILVALLVMAIIGAKIAGGIGILQGKRWGFIASAIFCGIGALGVFSGKSGGVYSLLDLAICVYCVLRLSGQIGQAVR